MFPKDLYDVYPKEEAEGRPASALMLRSHKLKEDELDVSVRCVARCGAGTNNIPVARMSELGIPVFNTPGANANAVKELVLCGLFLGSRRVIDGINHMKELGAQGLARERVEKDKSMFGGREIKGKNLAVIGLGHIGAATAKDGHGLGMNVVGYDPGLAISSALKLPREMKLADSISSAVANADYIRYEHVKIILNYYVFIVSQIEFPTMNYYAVYVQSQYSVHQGNTRRRRNPWHHWPGYYSSFQAGCCASQLCSWRISRLCGYENILGPRKWGSLYFWFPRWRIVGPWKCCHFAPLGSLDGGGRRPSSTYTLLFGTNLSLQSNKSF